jgi:metal-responsive CopG/Arc/MetJ family transcriptional regulator
MGVEVPSTAGYTTGMKVAISIPDDIFNDAERLAVELHCSRSQLYSRAVREYVDHRAADKITEALNAAYADDDQEEDLEFLRMAAESLLEHWEW